MTWLMLFIVIKKATRRSPYSLSEGRNLFLLATVQTLLLQLTVNHGLLDDGDNVGMPQSLCQVGPTDVHIGIK